MELKLFRNYKGYKKGETFETIDEVEIEYLKKTGTGEIIKEKLTLKKEVIHPEDNEEIEDNNTNKETLEELTIIELKNQAESIGLDLKSTKKADIIQEIIEFKKEAEENEV